MSKITIVGLGAGNLEQLPLGIYRILKKQEIIYVRTLQHPVIPELEAENMEFFSFDSVYEKHDRFEDVYQEIVDVLIARAKEEDHLIYAVPGHPIVAEKTVQLLLESKEIEVFIAGGQSFLDAIFTSVGVDPVDGFQFLDGNALRKEDINIFQHIIIAQVYDAFIASEVKLTLMEKYPDEFEVYIVTAAGSPDQVIKKVPLYELDRQVELNNLTSLYVPPVSIEEHTYKEFSVLRNIIAKLRGPDGCPWDQKQTHESLKKYLIEETYELLDAIDRQDDENIIEELGDVLLQVLLHSQIGEDEGMFAMEDVIEAVAAKMIRRHPHVFGDAEVKDAEEVKANWAEIKVQEKGVKTKVILDDVAKGLPALLRAYELQKKAAKAGFDWSEAEEAVGKFREEWQEFLVEVKSGDKIKQIEEFGDVLFSLVNIARFYDIHPEEALIAVNEKFYRRFAFVEQMVMKSGRSFAAFSLDELDEFWKMAKKEENPGKGL